MSQAESVALAGLRVLDLSSVRTGAQASQTLADFGAEVIHVEPPGGSPLRREAAWPIWGRGKRSLQLDLHAPADVALARRLASEADVVIETFRPGVADRLGLGYDELSAANPGLIYAAITGFGRTGPLAGLQGYEGVVAAKLGAFWTLAGLGGRPGPSFSTAADAAFPASQLAVHGILAALHARDRIGVGQRVETTLAQGLTVHDTFQWFARVTSGAGRPPAREANGAPTGSMAFRLLTAQTQDGHWLQFAQLGDRAFRAMIEMFGLGWMYQDPEWRGLPEFDDLERRKAFWERLLDAVRAKTAAQWSEAIERNPDVWAERYRQGAELLDHPQMAWTGMVVETQDPKVGRLRAPGPIARLELTPARVDRPAPSLGGRDTAWRAPRRPLARAGAAIDRDPPLRGVTIVELCSFYPAPYAASLLAELGARVIKLEPLEGDPLRSVPPHREAWALKALQGKECVAVDLGAPAGREIAHRIIAGADIVLQSFRAGAAERLGLGADALRQINPDLIVQSCPGYGEDGPCGRRPAFGTSMGAATGHAWRNVGASMPAGSARSLAEIETLSMRVTAATTGVGNADGPAAVANATSMLLALIARDRGGRGQRALTTMLSSAAHALSEVMADYDGAPPAPTPDPQLYGLGPLYRLYETADEWVFLAAPSEREWRRLTAALPRGAQLAGDPRFADLPSRTANADALADGLAAVFKTRRAADWETDLRAVDIACVVAARGPVEARYLDPGDVGEACGLVARAGHPLFGEIPRLAPLLALSRSATVVGEGALVGQHTEQVLREFGYDAATIASLAQARIVLVR